MRNIRKTTLISILALTGVGLAGSSDALALAPRPDPRPAVTDGAPCPNVKAVAMNGDDRLVCQQVGNAKQWKKQPIHLQVWRAEEICDQGIIQVTYGTEILVKREWTVIPDDGFVALQLHFIGNGAGPDGYWETIESAAGGEGTLRFDLGQPVPTWDLMRVIRTDGSRIASSGRQPTQACP